MASSPSTHPFPILPPISSGEPFFDTNCILTPRASFYNILAPVSPPINFPPRPSSFSSTDSGYSSVMNSNTSRFGNILRKNLPEVSVECPRNNDPPNTSLKSRIGSSLSKKKSASISSPQPVQARAGTSDGSGSPVTPSGETPATGSAAPPFKRGIGAHKAAVNSDERKYFLQKRGLKLHPYPRDEAPYMQAYNTTLLDNDRFTEILIQRLNPNGSPSFHNYGKSPPTNILDLGCGTGRWVLDAATTWRESRVTGFDLVDVVQDVQLSPNNVCWVRGNFLKAPLPFHDNTFDLVRMANLALCIPYDRWDVVLSEARRILMPKGRLEFIDDQMLFPYEKLPVSLASAASPSSPAPVHLLPSQSGFDSDDDESDTDSDYETTFEGEDDVMSSQSSVIAAEESEDHENKDPPMEHPVETRVDRAAEWAAHATNCKDLENVFERMLVQNGIYPRPQEIIENALERIFGRYHSNKISTMYLALAPSPENDSDQSSLGSADCGRKRFRDKWMTIEWDKKEKKDKKSDRSSGDSFSQVPGTINAKAAERLGIIAPASRDGSSSDTKVALSSSPVPESISAKAAIQLGINTASTPPRPTPPRQSPGLLLWPSTFIPMAPLELEMHTCKNIHVLLGCKSALADYLRSMNNANSEPVISDEDFGNIIWDYECFRRSRFNWPSEVPEYNMDVPPTPKSAHGRASLGSDAFLNQSRPVSLDNHKMARVNRDDMTFVRAIRVYEAIKVGEAEDFNPV